MRILSLLPHLSNEALQSRMNAQNDIRLFKYWQVLYCVQTNPGKQAGEYASLLGTDVSKIYRLVQLYNKLGAGFSDKLIWGGRRESRTLLSLTQEQLLMNGLKQKAVQGQIITMNDIRLIVEQKTKLPVSDDYLWDLFKRHGWKKKAPRPSHPKKILQHSSLLKKTPPVTGVRHKSVKDKQTCIAMV